MTTPFHRRIQIWNCDNNFITRMCLHFLSSDVRKQKLSRPHNRRGLYCDELSRELWLIDWNLLVYASPGPCKCPYLTSPLAGWCPKFWLKLTRAACAPDVWLPPPTTSCPIWLFCPQDAPQCNVVECTLLYSMGKLSHLHFTLYFLLLSQNSVHFFMVHTVIKCRTPAMHWLLVGFAATGRTKEKQEARKCVWRIVL